jgi:hypothetical protein
MFQFIDKSQYANARLVSNEFGQEVQHQLKIKARNKQIDRKLSESITKYLFAEEKEKNKLITASVPIFIVKHAKRIVKIDVRARKRISSTVFRLPLVHRWSLLLKSIGDNVQEILSSGVMSSDGLQGDHWPLDFSKLKALKSLSITIPVRSPQDDYDYDDYWDGIELATQLYL